MILLISVAALALLGLLSGLLLGFAYKQFAAEEDPRIGQVLALLPGSNCGACGFAGCRAFAEAFLAGKIDASGCLLGGAETAKLLAQRSGISLAEKEPLAAYLLCSGGKNEAVNAFEYQGAPLCKAANAAGGGFKACSYGCLGFGDCAKVCPVDAITMSGDLLPIVDVHKCIACGKCIKECPRSLFVLLPKKTRFHVNCNSKDKGASVRKACKVGCIACNLCVKACPNDAITLSENLAAIHQNTCRYAGECIKVCPVHTIVEFD